MATELKSNGTFHFQAIDAQKIKNLVTHGQKNLKVLQAQLNRHEVHNWFTDLAAKAGFITDHRRSMPNNIIANLALAKAEGVYTLSAFFDPARADGYLGASVKGYEALPNFKPSDEVPTDSRFAELMSEIIKSDDFKTQTQKIARYAPEISAYLAKGSNVPPEVKEFAQTLFGEKFAEAVYQKLGAAYDPNSINRFFPDGFRDFQKMNMYRYIFDLTHGLTSVLVRDKLNPLLYLERVFAAKWRRYDFANLTPAEVQKSVFDVLKVGQDRIKVMHHMPIDDRTPVAYRESIEVVLGWHTYDTKFLRWKKYWDEWELMGGGWNFICFVRKSIFNPFSVRQF